MTANHEFTVRFWGVRGSHPMPGEGTTRYGGNTPCVEVRAGGRTILLDAGTGIIGLGRALARESARSGKAVEATLFFSHLHHDHTQGFPFFAPAYLPNARLNLFVPDIYDRDPQVVLTEVMAAPTFPVAFGQTAAEKRIYRLKQNQIVMFTESEVVVLPTVPAALPAGAVLVRAMRSYAHPQGVMVYRLDFGGKSVVYATDTEGYAGGDQRLVAFARETDLLIHDAQYNEDHYLGALAGAPVTQGYGHSTVAMACETARVAGAGQLALFHHDPGYDDAAITAIERAARQRFPNTLAARESQVIYLGDASTRPCAQKTLPLARGRQSDKPASTWAAAA